MKKFQMTCKECGEPYWCPWRGSTWFTKSPGGLTLCRSCWTAGTSGLKVRHDLAKHDSYVCNECGKKFYNYITFCNHMLMEHNQFL
jgi:RNase P subunit RPR2